MSDSAAIPKVKIDPLGCYRQAFELLRGRYWLLLGVSAVGTVIASAVPIALVGPMVSGIYLCFLEAYRGRDFQFDLLFDGFDHFVPSLIASLIITGISLLLFIPGCIIFFAGMFLWAASSQAEGGQDAVPAMAALGITFALFLLLSLLLILLSAFFMFAFPLIVDRKLSGTDALVLSARAVAKNFGGVLGLVLIGVVLGLVGVLACYVGTFFLIPISFAAMTIAYRKVFPEIVAEPPSVAEGAAAPGPSGEAELPA